MIQRYRRKLWRHFVPCNSFLRLELCGGLILSPAKNKVPANGGVLINLKGKFVRLSPCIKISEVFYLDIFSTLYLCLHVSLWRDRRSLEKFPETPRAHLFLFLFYLFGLFFCCCFLPSELRCLSLSLELFDPTFGVNKSFFTGEKGVALMAYLHPQLGLG